MKNSGSLSRVRLRKLLSRVLEHARWGKGLILVLGVIWCFVDDREDFDFNSQRVACFYIDALFQICLRDKKD